MEAITIKNLTFTYPRQAEPTLKDICLKIAQGEFLTLCGKSGCGKSTLLRHFRTTLEPHGLRTGKIYFEETEIDEIDQRKQTEKIGFVQQSPENQIVTDKVWHELAFGLESLGYGTYEIRGRVSEMASFFGIQTWFHKKVTDLSGGQKQLLNLASIMVMQPSVLVLDEPTSQLDPIAAADFLETIKKINRELGTTIILTEHRLEDALPLSDRVVVMDKGSVIADGSPKAVGEILKNKKDDMFVAMPTPMRIYAAVENKLECPITVRDGRQWITKIAEDIQLVTSNNEVQFITEIGRHKIENSDEIEVKKAEPVIDMEPVIHMEDVWFRYERELPDVVKGLSVSINKGELFAIVGGNGTGKTTSMGIICGLYRPYRGTVRVIDQPIDKLKGTSLFENLMGVLPQNPQSFFVKKTVELDLYEMISGRKISKEEQVKKVKYVSQLCELDNLLEMHPYDLSGGEQQRAALAKVLLLSPKILLLDEPTKGLDGHFKEKLADILAKLQRKGVTIVMVSHDIEFCASYATRCAMFFDGSITSIDEPRRFFCGKNFYTTAANRMARTVLPKAVLAEDVILALGGVVPEKNRALEATDKDEFNNNDGLDNNDKIGNKNNWNLEGQNQLNKTYSCKKGKKKSEFAKEHPNKRGIRLTPVRIGVSLLFLSALVMTYLFFGGKYVDYRDYIVQFAMILELAICLGAIFPGNNIDLPDYSVQVSKEKRKLDKRTVTALIIVIFAVPFTIYMGVYYFGDRKYYFISLLIIIESMLPFALIFENRKPQARELMVIAVLCAIAVAGRAAFFMLPQFKPVIAIVIIAGVCFGGETGFMVGALTAFVSNMMFSQGPLTPWQMFAYGIVGLIAGVCFQKGLLLKRRTSLCIFGAITTMSICGLILDTGSCLTWQSNPTWGILFSYYLTGIVFNLIHAFATAFFLWFISEPMIEKLDRIKVKYGLIN